MNFNHARYCVGLTGTIASGKSTVAQYFSNFGIKLISADQISRALTASNTTTFDEIVTHFGKEAVNDDGELNRRHLRNIIFNDPKERIWLENLLHPLIRKRIAQDVSTCQSIYCIVEIPLLPDRKHYPYINRILTVLAEQKTQITRLMKRDNCSRTEAMKILDAQASDDAYYHIADDILHNNETIKYMYEQVVSLHAFYVQQAMKERQKTAEKNA